MSKFARKIELTANISIIVVALLVAGLLIHRYFFATSPATPKSPLPGETVQLADFDWSQSNKNVVLVLQKGCHFCAESADFYKRLIQQAQGKHLVVVAVLPQNGDEAEKYLSSLGISGIQVKQSPLSSLHVGGTPTVIITDNKGKITDLWLGKLSPEKENEVLTKLNG